MISVQFNKSWCLHTKKYTQQYKEKKKRLGVFMVKSTFLRRISPAFLASGLVQDGDFPDGGLDM